MVVDTTQNVHEKKIPVKDFTLPDGNSSKCVSGADIHTPEPVVLRYIPDSFPLSDPSCRHSSRRFPHERAGLRYQNPLRCINPD